MAEITHTNLSDNELRLILKKVLLSRHKVRDRNELLETLNFITSYGWDRRKIYLAVLDIYANQNDLTEREDDFFTDFIGEIRGEFGFIGLFRLPNEPVDKGELLDYVHKICRFFNTDSKGIVRDEL